MNNIKIFYNLLWRFLERCGAQGITFIVSIILARVLEPDAYGVVALIMVFITIFQVFVDSGMGNALIQKKNSDDIDFSSVFYFNLFVSSLFYTFIFFSAPLIAVFYNRSELTQMIRILGLLLIIYGIKNIQQSYVSKKLLFKKFFFSTLTGTIVAAVTGIGMAYAGFGAWALIFQQIINSFVDTFILWIIVKWRPKIAFSFVRLRELFSYGWKISVSSLLDTAYNNITSLIIGKNYSAQDLAFFEQGQKFPRLFVNNINVAIDSVLLPVLAAEQESIKRVKDITRKSIRISIFFMAPIMIGLATCGEYIIRIILTDKWLFCLPYLRLFCIVYMLYPLQTANLNAIKAIGRSDLFLKLEIVKKTIGFGLIVATMQLGVYAMAVGVTVTRVIYQVINAWPNKKLFNYGIKDIIKDISPSIISAVIMGAFVLPISFLNYGDIITLLLQILVAMIVYAVCSYFIQKENFNYVKNIFIGLKTTKRG